MPARARRHRSRSKHGRHRYAMSRSAHLHRDRACRAAGLTPSASALAWLSPIPPGVSVQRGIVWASPSRIVRLTSAPASCTATRLPRGPRIVALCSNRGAACLHSREFFNAREQVFVEAFRPARAKLEMRRTHDRVDDLLAEPATLSFATVTANTSATAIATPTPARSSWVARARAGVGGRCRGAYRGASGPSPRRPWPGQPAHPCAVVTRVGDAGEAVCSESPALSLPSRSVRRRSASAAASGSWVTSSTAASRSWATEWSSPTIWRLRALSRFPVGSSARISLGSQASARAIATR